MTDRRYKPADDQYATRVRESLARQKVMTTIGAELVAIAPGSVDIGFEYQPDLTQQHGFIHAGILSTVLDSACGYAAYSLMPSDAGILTIEFKINLLSPARGDRFVARGRVTRSGRTISVAAGDLFAEDPKGDRHIATMVATLMTITDRQGVCG